MSDCKTRTLDLRSSALSLRNDGSENREKRLLTLLVQKGSSSGGRTDLFSTIDSVSKDGSAGIPFETQRNVASIRSRNVLLFRQSNVCCPASRIEKDLNWKGVQ